MHSPVGHPAVPRHCLWAPAMPCPWPLSHLPDVIQELGGREALLRAGKLLAVVLEKGQQVRVQVKQSATARENLPSSHFLSFTWSPVHPRNNPTNSTPAAPSCLHPHL